MKISQAKKDKISEQLLAYLYSQSPKPLFTSHLALELARDEEFIKRLLKELKGKGLIISIQKNSHGKEYLRRVRWKLSNKAYSYYKQQQKEYIKQP